MSETATPQMGAIDVLDIFEPWRNESTPIRHLDLRQAFGVDHVALLDRISSVAADVD